MTEGIQKDKTNPGCLLFIDRMMDTVDIVVNQITSGRWILTVIAGACLLHFCWASKTIDEADKIIAILKDIVIFYFVVRDTNKPSTPTAVNTTTTTGDVNGTVIPSPTK